MAMKRGSSEHWGGHVAQLNRRPDDGAQVHGIENPQGVVVVLQASQPPLAAGKILEKGGRRIQCVAAEW